MPTALVGLLRPAHWAKNLFVLAPIVFAERLTDPQSLGRALLAFAAFCAASSAVYAVNDIRDRESDRRHPLKKLRPVASGAISVPMAWAVAGAAAALAIGLAWPIGWATAAIVAAYLAINLLYSFGLKHVVILDVMLLSLGFLLRVMAGALAVRVEVSAWLLLCTIFLALFLAFSKRRHELILLDRAAAEQRRVLSQYSPAFLDQMINVVTASSVVAYSLYCISPETAAKHPGRALVWTIPFVLFGIFRFLYLIYQRPNARNPTEQVLRDVPSLVNLALWGLLVIGIFYRR